MQPIEQLCKSVFLSACLSVYLYTFRQLIHENSWLYPPFFCCECSYEDFGFKLLKRVKFLGLFRHSTLITENFVKLNLREDYVMTFSKCVMRGGGRTTPLPITYWSGNLPIAERVQRYFNWYIFFQSIFFVLVPDFTFF